MTDLIMEIMSRCEWITASMAKWGLEHDVPVWEGPEWFER